MSELEAFIVETAKGSYRWEEPQGWSDLQPLDLEYGDAITVNPFPEHSSNAQALWAAFGEFRGYVTEDIMKVYFPETDENSNCWFKEEAGEYLIYEGYVTPQ